jgi:hypothetical protein
MATDPDAILVGADSHVYVAPVGTSPGTDPAVALSATWKEVGYTARDGIEVTPSEETTDVEAAQDMYAPRIITTGRALEIAFTMLEWNDVTLPLAFGGGAIVTATGVSTYNPPQAQASDLRALALEWADGAKKYRFVVVRSRVTTQGSFNVGPTAAAVLPITLRALGAGQSLPFYLMSNDPALVAA